MYKYKFILGVFFFSLLAWADGDFDVSSSEDLSALIEKARSEYVPIDRDWASKQARVLTQSLTELEKWFRSTGRERLWKKHIQWERLQKEIAKEAQADSKFIHEMAKRLFYDIDGMSTKPVINARRELLRFRDALVFGALDDKKGAFLDNLTALDKALKALKASPLSAEAAEDVGYHVGWLERTGQVPWLVKSVKRQNSFSNTAFYISYNYLASTFEIDVEQSGKINEEINGGQAKGTSRLEGRSSVKFLPNTSKGELELLVKGKLYSKSVWSKDIAHVVTKTTNEVCVSRKYYMTAAGIVGGRARVIQCKEVKSTQKPIINSILSQVQKEGYKKVQEELKKSNGEAAARTEEKLKETFESQIPKGLADLNNMYKQEIRDWYIRIGQYPQKLEWSTTKDAIQVKEWRWGIGQIGSRQPIPKPSKKWDMSFLMHQSDANNLFQYFFSGHTWTDADLKVLHNDLLGVVPPELQIGEHKRRWQITFSERKPFLVEFRDQKAFLMWRVDQVKIQKEAGKTKEFITYNHPIRITGSYKMRAPILEESDFGPTGIRIGQVKVDNLNPDAEAPEGLVKFLQKKFNDVFPKKLQAFGLVPPEGGQFSKLTELGLKELTVKNGWAILGWKASPEEE